MRNRQVVLNCPTEYITPNDLGGYLTSDLKPATLITLVSMCILPLTSLVTSEAMAAFKKHQRSYLSSKFNSVTSITYDPMSLWLPKASMS